MKLVKMLTPPIKASVISFAFLAALSARANSSFDWTGEGGVVTIPAGVAAEVLDEDIAAVEALTSIVQADKTSRILFKNTQPLVLTASITGPGGNGNRVTDPANIETVAGAGHITFNGDIHFTDKETRIILGNCTVNAEIGSDGNYYYVTALADCTVRYSETSEIIRRYLAHFYGPGTHRIASRFPSGKNQTFAQASFSGADGGARVVFEADDIVYAEVLLGDAGTVIDLNGTSQSTVGVRGGSVKASSNPSVVEVTSAEPATLSLAGKGVGNNEEYFGKDQLMSVAYTGALTVNLANEDGYTNHYMYGVSTTTGGINITKGPYILDGESQWAVPAVTMTGGRLVARSAAGSLSSETDLALSGTAVVEVPKGKVLRVKSVTVGGQDLGLHGIYSVASLAATYPGFFEGEGAVSTMDGDPRAELSAAMSLEGLIAVEDVTSGFAVDVRGGIAATTGDEMTFAWKKSPAADTTTYALTVKAEGDAEVSVYVDGGDTPVDTVTAADGAKQVTFSSAESVRVRLVIAGEAGSARVYGFANEISAKIYAPKGGVNVTGANVGTNYVGFGEALSFTVARVFDSDDRIASGLNVNGKFVAFDDLPDATFAWAVDDFDTSVIIETVYDETTYYVDDTKGSDTENSGRHPSIAFKTIKHAMGLASSGYTIVVAPGTYGDEPDDEVMGSEGDWCRVSIKSGVTLKASGSAAETIILGREATEPISYQNYSRSGTDSARCVTMAANTRIEGFTLTRGCATWSGDTSKTTDGGGISADNNTNCRIVDCVISNCYATKTACAGNKGLYLRCRITDCRNGNTYGYGLRAGAKAYNSLFVDMLDGVSTCNGLFYCTFYQSASVSVRQVHSEGGPIRGCVFMSLQSPSMVSNCSVSCSLAQKFQASTEKMPIFYDDYSKLATYDKMAIWSDGQPSANSAVRDLGDTYADYLAAMLAAGWTEEEASVDFAGNPRCLGGRVNAGCCEFDCRGEMATMLDPLGFVTIASVSPTVTAGGDQSLTMPAGTSLELDWASSVAEGEVEYSFDAEVSGEAVLEAYLDGADEPYAVVRAADGKRTVDVVKTGDAFVRLVVRGEGGAAKVSKFVNAIYAIVLAPSGGVSIVGTQFGTNYVAQGSSLTFTVRRKFDSADVLATGVTVNGEFVSFEDHPEGVTLTVDSKATSVNVQTVYAEKLDTWYVDAVNGNNANYGRHPSNARRTLAAAMDGPVANDTVIVLPGVYSNDVMNASGKGYSRVEVPAGVTLRSSEGPEKTVILGQAATEPLWEICGTDSARCVYLNANAKLRGFTLTGGATTSNADGTDGESASAVYVAGTSKGTGVHIVDCIISNNFSVGTYTCWNGRYLRCQVLNNTTQKGYATGVRDAYAYNCVFRGMNNNGYMDTARGVVNCTFDSGSLNALRSTTTSSCPDVYNSVFISTTDNPALTYHNCVFTRPNGQSGTLVGCLVTNEAALAMSDDFTLAKDSVCVDFGGEDDYIAQLKEAGFSDEEIGLDLYRSPRHMNGKMDAGACEFDWRDTYRGDLGRAKWLAVEAVSSNVVETADGAVRLTDGATLTLTFTIPANRLDGEKFVEIPFVRTGAGALTATLDGESIEPVDGAFAVAATKVSQTLVLSYSGEGHADFTKMRRNAGVVLIVR